MYSKEELKEAGLDDFRVFLTLVWQHLGLPKPTKVQLDIAKWLQHGPERVILQAFRGVGKSWITVAFVAWTLLLDPQKKILVVSAGETLAKDFTFFLLKLIREMPVLQHLEPQRGQRSKTDSFDVGPATPTKDPSVKSVGITGQLTGTRADLIIADDVEVPKNSFTHLLREKLSELVKEFDSILKPNRDGNVSRVIYLGTPQVEQSLYARLYKDRGYKTCIWPAEIPGNIDKYNGRLAPFVARLAERFPSGAPVDPERFNSEDLENRKLSQGRANYALQFMLDTSPADAEKHPLKLKDLLIHDADPDMGHVKMVWSSEKQYVISDLPAAGFDGDYYHRPAWKSEEMAKYTRTVMFIDPSGKGTDETAYAILKELHGQLTLVDIGGYVDGYGEETLKALAGKASRWGVNKIVCEENYGGGMFTELLRPWLQKVGRDCIDREWKAWSSARKEDRICDVLGPVVASHRLLVDRKVVEEDAKLCQDDKMRGYSFIYQYTRMSRVKGELPHDDRVDALAGAVAYCTERMARDTDKALKRHREEILDKELKTFMAHALGRSVRTNLSWHRGRSK